MGRKAAPKPEYEDGPDAEGRRELPTYVYVAKCETRVKIGVAGDVQLRMRQLRTGSGLHVEAIASRLFSTRISAEEIELQLHRKFQGARLFGEWFATDARKVVTALNRYRDPELHTRDWFPGMPPEVAAGDAFDRWHWRADNGIRPVDEFIRRFGPRKGRTKYLAQVPVPGQWK